MESYLFVCEIFHSIEVVYMAWIKKGCMKFIRIKPIKSDFKTIDNFGGDYMIFMNTRSNNLTVIIVA